jgi:hypothetical protein
VWVKYQIFNFYYFWKSIIIILSQITAQPCGSRMLGHAATLSAHYASEPGRTLLGIEFGKGIAITSKEVADTGDEWST